MKFELKNKASAKEFSKKILERVNDVKRMGAIEAYTEISKASPVLTGRFRWGWNCSINAIDYSTPDPAPQEYQKEGLVYYLADEGGERAKKVFLSVKINESCFISNALQYAKRLNEGWSQQAPKNFVELTAKRVQENLSKYAKEMHGKDDI